MEAVVVVVWVKGILRSNFECLAKDTKCKGSRLCRAGMSSISTHGTLRSVSALKGLCCWKLDWTPQSRHRTNRYEEDLFVP